MALFGLFRGKSPIADAKGLTDFIDEQFPHLHEGLEISRSKAYPLGLAMIGEMIDGALRPHAGTKARALADETIDLVLGVFDRQPVPAEIGQEAWRDARSELALRLDQISAQPSKGAADIPVQYVKRYLKFAPGDTNATLDVLGSNLVKIQHELEKRMDAAATVKSLLAAGEN